MKKFKKLLAGLLAGAMMLGSMTTTAFAEDSATPATVSTIDPSQKGSLTIHKYYFKNNQPDGLTAGTGEQVSNDELPEGATALKGAEFSIWKIADVEGNVTIENKTTEKFIAEGNLTNDVARARALITNNGVLISPTASDITNDNGIVTFDQDGAGLEFGIYYVRETRTPANISSTPSEFVVSVPMTSQKTNKGAQWIYDVHVYPKNVKTEAGVTIKKVNAGGDDIVANAKFVLQKKDSNNNWKYVKKIENGYDYEATSYDPNGSDKASYEFAQGDNISGLGNGDYRLLEVSADYGYIMDGTVAYEFSIANDGEITGSESYLTYVQNDGKDNKKSAIITVKNERPDLEKKVEENNTWQNHADKALADDIEYRVKVTIPSNIAKLNTFKITDTPTNIIDDTNSVKIYTDEDCTAEASLDKDTDYTITSVDNRGFVLNFVVGENSRVTDKFANYAGSVLYVRYKANLTDNAVSTVAGNLNTVKLDYSNGIYPASREDDELTPGGDQDHAYIEDKAVVYTFKFTIKKTDESGEALTGAHFALYKCSESGLTSESAIKNGTLVQEWTDDKTSEFKADKLEAGYYYVIETKAPNGYNLLTSPVEIKELNVQYETKWSTNSEFVRDTDSEGNPTGPWHLVKREKTSTTFTYTDDGTTKNFTDEKQIVNKKGFTLPVTGGMGTVIFSVLGIALVLAGLLVITASRKKAAK